LPLLANSNISNIGNYLKNFIKISEVLKYHTPYDKGNYRGIYSVTSGAFPVYPGMIPAALTSIERKSKAKEINVIRKEPCNVK